LGRSRTKPLTIAFQGEHGAFSEEAARKLAGEGIRTIPCQWFDEAFRRVAEGKARAAVIPIENTLHGSVHENYDHLLDYKLEIVGETQIRIVHNLIAPPGVGLSRIRRVYSHPVALNQCLRYFEANPQIEKTPFYDTAGSVKMLMDSRPDDAGAIASAAAAEVYGARILNRSIEDDRQNFTRFFRLMRDKEARARLKGVEAKSWKTSLVFSTKNRPGAIFRALGAFALRDLSLTKVESRPFRGKPWEYLFYLDFLGDMREDGPRNAVAHLAELADFYHVLGCYPRGA
jgi:prephenate dehydratase